MKLYVASIYALKPVEDHADIETRTVFMIIDDEGDAEFEMKMHILKEFPESEGWYNHNFICDEFKRETAIGDYKIVMNIEGV